MILVALVGLAFLIAPGSAVATAPVPGARYADTDYAFWVNLRVSRSGRTLAPRVENVSSWQCRGLDFHVRRVRISRTGRFDYRRRHGRFVLTVAGRFTTKERARISFRYRRVPRRKGRECDDSGRVSLAPERVVPVTATDCRTHEDPDLLLTPEGRVFSHRTWYGRDGWGSAAWGCVFSVNRSFKLGQDEDDDNDLDDFLLVEPYLAYEHAECGMGCFYSLHVQDLRDGAVRHLPREPLDSFGDVTDIELRSTGSVAWIAEPRMYGQETQPSVWADDGLATRRLDTGNIALDSLELNGTTLTWTRDGAQQSATLD